MTISYLYLDDSKERIGVATGLSVDETKLKVYPSKPNSWADILKEIANTDGLLLDWQLQLSEDKSDYSSSALGQEVRELVNQGILERDIPIILCSAQEEFERKFQRDKTSHDLFDMVYSKINLSTGDINVLNQFVALGEGYKILNIEKNFFNILNIKHEDIDSIDIRLLDEIKKLSQSPAHELARLILKEVVHFEGILVDEDVLAARLGIDKNESHDFSSLLKKFEAFEYTGVFSNGWKRWWWYKIENWWLDTYKVEDLKSISAKKRVELISSNEGLSLVAASPMKYCYSDEFWTVCYITKKPIDRYEGFLLDIRTFYPWQENFYISKEAVIDEINIDSWRINILDKQRVENFKESLEDE